MYLRTQDYKEAEVINTFMLPEVKCRGKYFKEDESENLPQTDKRKAETSCSSN